MEKPFVICFAHTTAVASLSHVLEIGLFLLSGIALCTCGGCGCFDFFLFSVSFFAGYFKNMPCRLWEHILRFLVRKAVCGCTQ